jgi:hypothetical protein
MLHRLGATETGLAFLDQKQQNQQQHTTRGGGGGGAGTGRGYGYLPSPTSPLSNTKSKNSRASARNGILGSSSPSISDKSPLEQHLPRLNIALAALSLLTGLLERVKLGPTTVGVSPVLLGALPGVVYAVVVGAKVVMAGVDPERELGGLRYGYKGA